MSGKDEPKKVYYYIDRKTIDKIFSKFEELIDRQHELDSRQQLTDQKVKYHKKATEAEQKKLREELETKEQQLRDQLKDLREKLESQGTISGDAITAIETLKNNWQIFAGVAILLAYFLKDVIVSKLFGGN